MKHFARSLLASIVGPWLACTLQAAGYQVGAFRIEGIAGDIGTCLEAFSTPSGLIVGTEHGYLQQDGTKWNFIRAPVGSPIAVVIPTRTGIMAAGDGFCLLHSDHGWRDTGIRDTIADLAAHGPDIFAAGLNGVYRIDALGSIREVMRYAQPLSYSTIHTSGGELLLATYGPVKGYRWTGRTFLDISAREGWDESAAIQVWWIEHPDNRDGYAYGSHVWPSWYSLDARTERVLAGLWPGLLKAGPTGRLVHAGDCIYVPTKLGILCDRLTTGQELWRVSPDELDGTPFAARVVPEGVLVSSSGGLTLIVDPTYAQFARIPKAEVYRLRDTPEGLAIFSSAGTFWADGRDASYGTKGAYDAVDLPSGRTVSAEFKSLDWAGTKFPLGAVIFGCQGMEALDNSTVVVLKSQQLRYMHESGSIRTVYLPAPGRTLSLGPRSHDLLVATSDGALAYDAAGRKLRQFGVGETHTFVWRDSAMAVDASGTWWDERGRQLGRLPFTALVAGFEWRGRLCLAGRFPDGRIWAGLWDEAEHRWRALDLPFPSPPLALGADGDHLIAVMNGSTMAVSEPRYLAPPVAQFTAKDRGPDFEPFILPPELDSIELALPAARLAPWSNPEYRYQVGDGEWQTVPAGSTVRIPRLGWGHTDIQLTATLADLDSTATYTITRELPWWLSWPGWIGAIAALGIAAYGLVRWRTGRLRGETQHLEQVVTARTAELKAVNADLEKANAVKADFIASINHEIRTPLNGVVGITRMLEQEAAPDRRRLLVHTLHACTDQLRATVEGVLDFAAMQQGRIAVHEHVFDLGDLVAGTCDGADPDERRIRLIPWSAAPLWLRGDAGKLRLILGNYLSNALKYGVPPGADVEVAPETLGPGRMQLTVSVHSTGPTLAPDELAVLFGEFVRGRRAAETNAKGTGLGLALCRRYASAMGGSAGVRSREGRTTFWVNLPFAVSRAPDRLAAAANLRAGPRRILAVEDEPYNRLILGHYLHQLGLEVDWAPDASSALALAEPGRFQAVLTDWSLPDRSGPDFFRELILRFGSNPPPIMVISAHASADKQAEAKAAGARAFLAKPIDEEMLAQALHELDLAEAPAAPAGGVAPAEPAPGLDLRRLLALGERAEVVENYSRDLAAAWAAARTAISTADSQNAGALVHRLRSQVLVVRALEASFHLEKLERALAGGANGGPPEALVRLAEGEINSLLAALREA